MPLICSIELDREEGVTVKVIDDKGAVSQMVHLDGTTITLEVTSKSAKSRFEQRDEQMKAQVEKGQNKSSSLQTSELIELKCKSFKIEADSFEVTTENQAQINAGGDLNLETAGKLNAKSKGKTSIEASGDFGATAGTGLTLKGGSKATLEAPQLTTKGSMQMVVDGGTTLQIKGTKVDLKGAAQLTAGAPITNIGENMTSVRGQLVKLEGTLVKIG